MIDLLDSVFLGCKKKLGRLFSGRQSEIQGQASLMQLQLPIGRQIPVANVSSRKTRLEVRVVKPRWQHFIAADLS